MPFLVSLRTHPKKKVENEKDPDEKTAKKRGKKYLIKKGGKWKRPR